MKSGFLPKEPAPDEVIAGSQRDPSLLEADPREPGAPEDVAEPALAETG